MELSGLVATLWKEQVCRLFHLRVACWKTNAPTQPNKTATEKEALPGSWAWSLLLSHGPSLVVNTELVSQTKQGPSVEVARHSVWCAQTFWLLTGQLGVVMSSPRSTLLMCVYFYQTPWENCPALWQLVTDKEFLFKIEISGHPQSSKPFWVSELGPRRLVLEKNRGIKKQHCGSFRTVMNWGKTLLQSPKRIYEHLTCNKLIKTVVIKLVFLLRCDFNFSILCFPTKYSLQWWFEYKMSPKPHVFQY